MTSGRYGAAAMTLAEAPEQFGGAKKLIAAVKCPPKEKARGNTRIKGVKRFGAWAERWLRGYQMAYSNRDMRKSVCEHELKPKFAKQELVEMFYENPRALTYANVERDAPVTAVHAREKIFQVYRVGNADAEPDTTGAELVTV